MARNKKGYRKPPVDDTLGFRAWNWNGSRLTSPAQGTVWEEAEMRVDRWDRDDAVRGVAGIHAMWPVPKQWQSSEACHAYAPSSPIVGIVERWGHFVLGEDGWRSEWVVIKELAAPVKLHAKLREAYPDVKLHERAEDPAPDLVDDFNAWRAMMRQAQHAHNMAIHNVLQNQGYRVFMPQTPSRPARPQNVPLMPPAGFVNHNLNVSIRPIGAGPQDDQAVRDQIARDNLAKMPGRSYPQIVSDLGALMRASGAQRFADWHDVINGCNDYFDQEHILAIANCSDPVAARYQLAKHRAILMARFTSARYPAIGPFLEDVIKDGKLGEQ